VWLGFRLAELLPLTREEQQQLLEMTDPLQRLATLRDILPRFQKA
jgi:Lon protease-like protein